MKRIVTCSDGTWNKPNKAVDGVSVRTNVQKIFDYILTRDKNGVQQVKFYDEGVGAAGSFFTRLIQGATGKGIDENILDIYKFICWNYEHENGDEDEIYLFGFSRGAYTARSLAGLIRKCGILEKNDLRLFKEAYDLYRDRTAAPDSEKATKFRQKNSFEVSTIKFIGVWDTVGSLGIPLHAWQYYNKSKYEFYDTTLSSIVEHAYHALAVDEKRGNFKPALWEKSKHITSGNFEQKLEQRWFSGVHSNVGGGYPDEGLADGALKWMIEKAKGAGLALDEEAIRIDVKPNAMGKLYNSREGIYALLPKYVRPTDTGIIDQSVYERIRSVPGYGPENINPGVSRKSEEE